MLTMFFFVENFNINQLALNFDGANFRRNLFIGLILLWSDSIYFPSQIIIILNTICSTWKIIPFLL